MCEALLRVPALTPTACHGHLVLPGCCCNHQISVVMTAVSMVPRSSDFPCQHFRQKIFIPIFASSWALLFLPHVPFAAPLQGHCLKEVYRHWCHLGQRPRGEQTPLLQLNIQTGNPYFSLMLIYFFVLKTLHPPP